MEPEAVKRDVGGIWKAGDALHCGLDLRVGGFECGEKRLLRLGREREHLKYVDVDEDAAVEWNKLDHHQILFLKKHSPSVVKRLDSGAVVLLAYPWRNLWPLWSDALRLLGIRP